MTLKEKAGLIALAAGVVNLIGFLTPYIWFSLMGMTLLYWSWGLVSVYGMIIFAPGVPFGGILILISVIMLLGAGAAARKREDTKTLGIVIAVAAVLGLIGVFIPLVTLPMGFPFAPSMGFFLPLIGSILGIIAGVAAAVIE